VQINNVNGVIVNITTSKALTVESTVFPHRKIHKYTWTSSNHIDDILKTGDGIEM
jgi:hypothetical protein